MIKSTSYSQKEIIENIIDLHCGGELEVDLTYSTGSMYKGCKYEPFWKFDIDPKDPSVVKQDARKISFSDDSLKSIMFDPPFLATTGKSLKEKNDGNLIVERFSCFPNEKSLHEFYVDVLKECQRVLVPNGILIFKCQDKVSSGKQYWSHCFIQQEAIKVGFYPLDLFVLLSKARMTPKWQVKNQKHARKYHCYFWVFKKNNRKMEYV